MNRQTEKSSPSSDKKVLGYLSGAPRVSTKNNASTSGPRAHVIGSMGAYKDLGWQVKPYIVGDYMPSSWVTQEVDTSLGKSAIKRLFADLIRLFLSVINMVLALIKVGKADWVYERFGAFQALGCLFQRRGIPWILETNGLFFIESAKDRSSILLTGIEKKIELWVYRQADVIVTITEELKKVLIEFGIEGRKIIVVPNGVDTERFNSNIPPKRLTSEPVIGFVGTLIKWQALDHLIYALAQLRDEGIIFQLVIIGDGPFLHEWRELVDKLGLNEQVQFPGRVPGNEIPAYINGFDLGFTGQIPLEVGKMYHSPLKLYEYMSCGKPVIASAFEDSRRIVQESSAGFLFQAGDIKDLVRALREAYNHKDWWREMGARAREVVVEHHTWVSRVRDMITTIEKILEEKYGNAYPERK